MPVYFTDTSALARRYIAETGSAWVQHLLDPVAGNVIIIARITAVELVAAITRRERGGSIAPGAAAAARADFRTHLGSEYQVVEVDQAVVDSAMVLAETYGLRGYDAIQPAAAGLVNARYVAAGLARLTLLSADGDLNAAAAAEGLLVDDPGSHP